MIPLRESTPSQIPLSVIFTLLYIEKFFSNRWSRIRTAMAQTSVTNHPVKEKLLKIWSSEVPVFLKKEPKVLIANSRISPE